MAYETDLVSFGFSMVVITGGMIGFVKAGSTISLVMGLVFGGLSAFGAVQTSNDPKNIWVSLGASGVLAIAMGSRFFKSGKFMPAGLVFTLSVLQTLRLLYRLSH